MIFSKRYSINRTSVRNGDGLALVIGEVHVSIRETTYEHDATKPLLLLEATCERTPPPEVSAWLLSSIKSPTLDAPPDEIHEYLGPLVGELSAACRRSFELLRWRTASDTPHNPYGSLGDFFSADQGLTWHRMGFRGSVVGWQVLGLPLNERTQIQVQELLADLDASEPVAHVLLREALDSRTANPRSAVVVGVAALETGIKSTIAELVPGSGWLVENLPSPPVTKLLNEYMPTLPVKLKINGSVHKPPKEARRLIAIGIEERNRLAHRGVQSMSTQNVLDLSNAIQNTLYLLGLLPRPRLGPRPY